MMGMGSLEVIVILLIAFIFLGPQKMIEAARALGKLVGQAKNMAADIPHLDLDDIDEDEILDQSRTVDGDQLEADSRLDNRTKNEVMDDPIPFRSRKKLATNARDGNDEDLSVSDGEETGHKDERGSSGEVREG